MRNDHTDDSSPLLPGGKYVETRLALFYLVYFSYMIAFSTYFPLWMAQRHYSPSEIAGVLVLPQLLRIFVSLVWARLAEWCSESPNILALSFTLAAVICVLIGLSSTLAEVFFWLGYWESLRRAFCRLWMPRRLQHW